MTKKKLSLLGQEPTFKMLLLRFIDIFPNQVLNSLNIFTEHSKIIADYTKKAYIEVQKCFVGMLLYSDYNDCFKLATFIVETCIL